MRVLFAHETAETGSVHAQLLLRARFLEAAGVRVDFTFREDAGVAAELAAYGRVLIEPSHEALVALFRERIFDLVVPIDSTAHLDALDDAKTGVPVLLEIHTTSEHPLHRLGTRLGFADAELVPSEAQRTELVRRFHLAPDQIYALPFMIDRASLAETSLGALPRRPILLWVGRLDAAKGWPSFLEIGALLQGSGADPELWIIGGGASPDEIGLLLIETAAGLGLAHRMRWLPELPHASMGNAYALAAKSGGLFLATSQDESFGTSAAEALVCGLPVVAPNEGAFIELGMMAGAGALIELYDRRDPSDAAARIQRMLSRGPRAAGGERLAEALAPRTLGPELLRILRDVATLRVGAA